MKITRNEINEAFDIATRIKDVTTERDRYRENLEWLVYWCLRQDDPPISIGRGKELLGFTDMNQMRAWMADYSMRDTRT